MSAPNYSETNQTGHDGQPASWGTWAESHEGLECLKCPEPHVFPVSPVPEGQDLEAKLIALAALNACTQLNTARTRRFKLLQDLKAVQKQVGRRLQIGDLTTAFDEWYRLSLKFLDPAKTRDDYEAKFLSDFQKSALQQAKAGSRPRLRTSRNFRAISFQSYRANRKHMRAGGDSQHSIAS